MAKTVDAQDPDKKTSEILGPTSDEATVQMNAEKNKCFWNDEEFAQGEQIESEGKRYECSFGRWLEIS